MPFYAVKRGRIKGIFKDWALCKAQVDGFSHCAFKKFDDLIDAEDYLSERVDLEDEDDAEAFYARQTLAGAEHDSETGALRVYVAAARHGHPSNLGRWPARVGCAVYLNSLSRFNKAVRLPGAQQDINRGQLYAILLALQLVPKDAALVINTESSFAFLCFTQWLTKWKRNGFRNAKHKAVAHADLLQQCVQEVETRGLKVTFACRPKVPSTVEADAADLLAHKGAWIESTGSHRQGQATMSDSFTTSELADSEWDVLHDLQGGMSELKLVGMHDATIGPIAKKSAPSSPPRSKKKPYNYGLDKD